MNEARKVPDYSRALFIAAVLLVGFVCILGPLLIRPVLFGAVVLGAVSLFILGMRPEHCVVGFLLLLPVIPRSYYTPAFILPVGLDFGRAYFPVFFLAVFVHWVRKGDLKLLSHRAHRWLLLWVIVTLVQFPRALDVNDALLQRLIPFLSAVLCYCLFSLYARGLRQVELIFKVLLIASLVVITFGVIESVSGKSLFWKDIRIREGQIRLASTLENPQVLGTFLLMCLPMAGVFLKRAKHLTEKTFWGCFICGYLAIILLTFTRSAWLGCLVLGLLFVRNTKSFVLLTLLLMAFYWSPFYTNYMLPVLTSHEAIGNIMHRLYVFKKAVFIIKDHFLLGIGLDNFSALSVAYDEQFIGTSRHLHDPGSHNTFLTFASELGVFGFVGVVGLIIASLKSVWPMYKDPDRYGEPGHVGRALFLALVAAITTGLTYQAFQWATLISPFLVLLACCHLTGALASSQQQLNET